MPDSNRKPTRSKGVPAARSRSLTHGPHGVRQPELRKQEILRRVQDLPSVERTFVSEIFRRARAARGRLDEDVYGILQVTLEALDASGGAPPPLIFGVSHYQTGRVEQVGFLPPGVRYLPPHGRFVTNHPGLRPRGRLRPGDVPRLPPPD